jgi:hypothetical protein
MHRVSTQAEKRGSEKIRISLPLAVSLLRRGKAAKRRAKAAKRRGKSEN